LITVVEVEMKHSKQQRVFLSGRLDSDWQDRIVKGIPDLEYYDPRTHKLDDPMEYSAWDLHHIKKADILFCYMEKGNPSGYGLATEVGYARGLGKTVILVDDKSGVDVQFKKHFAIVRELADVTLNSLDEGIAFLKRFAYGADDE